MCLQDSFIDHFLKLDESSRHPHTLTTSMELSLSWEAESCSDTKEIPNISWNPEIHYRVQENFPLIPILGQMNPGHTTPSYFSEIHFSIILSPTSGSS
jgi:hypothetical protein